MPQRSTSSQTQNETEPQEVPFVSYNMAVVLKRKRKIQNNGAVFVGRILDRETFQEFVEAIRLALPNRGRDIDEDVVIASLRHLAAQKLTSEMLAETAWRLGGNLHRLRSCTPVLPWGLQPLPEWVPVQMLRCNLRWTKGKSRKYGATFYMRIMAGLSCPLMMYQFWTSRFCGLISRDMGFTFSRGPYPYRDPREFIGLRFYAKVDPCLSEEAPSFHEIRVTSGCKNWNRKLLVMRARSDPEFFRCPFNHPGEHPCYLCPVGQDRCDAAVHERTFVQRRCRRCRRRDAWFDPMYRRKICVDCFHELRKKGEL